MILNCTVFTLRQLKCCQWAPRPPAFKFASALSSDVKQTGRILLLSLLFPFSHLCDKLNHAASHVTMDSRTVAATHFIWCYVHVSKLLQFLRLFVCSWWWWLFWISLVEWLTVGHSGSVSQLRSRDHPRLKHMSTRQLQESASHSVKHLLTRPRDIFRRVSRRTDGQLVHYRPPHSEVETGFSASLGTSLQSGGQAGRH